MGKYNERDRLDDLYSYQIIDTPPEEELDEFAEMASLFCEAPVSLITLIDDKTQWFKAKKGIGMDCIPRKDSFCQYALDKPNKILVVNDLSKDERFKDNPFVAGEPKARFYAGMPLVTPKGNVLGTLCVIDFKTRSFPIGQQRALQVLAHKAMEIIETRKRILEQGRLIGLGKKRLKNLTENLPVGIFQLNTDANGVSSFEFVNEAFLEMHQITEAPTPEIVFHKIHPDDLKMYKNSFENSRLSLSQWSIEYRTVINKKICWFLLKANPEKTEDGNVLWYGNVQDITNQIEYLNGMGQIAFDLSHVLRGPVARLLGLSKLIEEDSLESKHLHKYVQYIKDQVKQLEALTRELNENYQVKLNNISEKAGRTIDTDFYYSEQKNRN